MEFDIIATQEHSHADFSALLAFSSSEEATISTKAINDSQWANTQSLTPGQSGAFQVRKHVMFNTYSKAAYGEIIDMLKKLPAPATDGDISKLYKDMWNSLVDIDAPYSEARDFAIPFFTKVLPGATVETMENDGEDNMVIITYRGEVFRAKLLCDGEDTRIKVFASGIPDFAKPSFSIYEGNEEDIKKIFDDFVDTQAFSGNPEEAIFNLVNSLQNPRQATDSDKATLLSAATAFITKHIPGATNIGDTECGSYGFDSYDSDPDLKDWSIERYGKGNWADVWFYYNGNEFWLEFLVTSKKNEIRLWSVHEDGSDNAYCVVTADNIKFAIDSVDDEHIFNGNAVKIFEILKKLDLDNNCIEDANKIFKKNKKSINKAAMAYLDDYLPKVKFDDCVYDCSGYCERYGDDCEWIELWFFHKKKNYHIDFVVYDNGTVKLFLCSANKNYEIIDSVVTTPEGIKEFLKSVDKEGHFVKPEEKIFEILPNATKEVYLSDDNHPEYIEASKEFLNKYLPDATFDCADSNGNGDNAWFNIRFVYNGHKFGLDFTRADSKGGTRSYEIYEIFKDGDYTGEFSVTPETLRETIKKEFLKDEAKEDHFAKPEEKIIEILKSAPTDKYISDKDDSTYAEAGIEFLKQYLPEATYDSSETHGASNEIGWYALFFTYKGNGFRLEITRNCDTNTVWYEFRNIDKEGNLSPEYYVDYKICPKNLKRLADEPIEDETLEEEPLTEEPSIETRVTKLENLMDQVQKEIKEIKKKI